jgi:phage tail-like protein
VIQPANVAATPDPRGGSILLTWTNPVVPGFSGTRVLRRELAFPEVPGDIGTSHEILNDTTTPEGQPAQFLDSALKSETVYYYAVVSYDLSAQTYTAFTTAMSTAPYQTGAYLYQNLPGIYQSYDTALPPPSPAMDPADYTKGQLQRFLELFGLEFDVLRSFAAGMRAFFDSDRVDGALLPLFGDWIGWQTDYTLNLPQRRNQIRYAPHYFATAGIAANLRATVNRLTTWDTRIKELSHNIFLSNIPEQLTLWEQERQGAAWQPEQLVSLDLAYEGRPSACLSPDGRRWLFYHARASAPTTTKTAVTAEARDRFHLRYKVFEQGAWLPARPLTQTMPLPGIADTNRAPAAVLRSDGTFWVFWSSVDASGAFSRLRVQRISAGRSAWSARIAGTTTAPFPLADGDTFQITIGAAPGVVRRVTFRAEQFADITHATALEVVNVLRGELPGVQVSATEAGSIQIVSGTAGSASVLAVPASAGATKLGLASPPAGTDAASAKITGSGAGPFALASGDTLLLTLDNDVPRFVTFDSSAFLNIAAATTDEVVSAINAVTPGAARNLAGRIEIDSAIPGADSMVSIDLSLSTAAPKLGLGQMPPAPPAGTDETEPAAFEDSAGNLWLFWSSRRAGTWDIWYSALSAAGWANPKQLTTGPLPDREPAALIDSAGGRIWVFWSRKKANGLWNVFSRNTTVLTFNTQTAASWTEAEFAPAPANFDNREAAPVLTSAGTLEVYFTSDRTEGWNVWSRPIAGTVQGADSPVTSGQFTRRTPVPLLVAPGRVHLWFRNNETVEYESSLYPSARTLDGRYAGSTTADTRNPTRLSSRGDIQDIQHYTYEVPLADAQKETARLYSRDTIGVFLTPDTQDEQLIIRSRTLIGNVLKNFLPIQTRVVFVIDQAYIEYVYSYDAPAGAPAQTIGERMIDDIISEVAPAIADRFTDTVNFKFLKTWTPAVNSGALLDTTAHPPDLSFRLLLVNVNEGP